MVTVAMDTDNSAVQSGLDRGRLERALDLLRREVQSGLLPAVSAAVFCRGRRVAGFSAGHLDPDTRGHPVREDTQFIIASLTKPVVCAAAMLLLEEGRFSLDEPVCLHVPEFDTKGKETTLIRHLLTHTSGLPDQLPEGTELRKRHATRAEFVRAVCDCTPLFPPGRGIRYQSMGILMLSEIMERVTGVSTAEILRERLFAPLGMGCSVLGMPSGGIESTALVLPPAFGPSSPDYGADWNTEYWRSFGCPWGGLHSTADDLGLLLLHMLGERAGPLSEASRRAMCLCQTDLLPEVAERDRRSHRWGLGWMLGAAHFGSLASPGTFGHVGATGTLMWADPASSLATVLLTSQPRVLRDDANAVPGLFARYSNALAAAVRGYER
jgi:CubicO group peptidase (beta-lactamase class C family)